ncbi:hypothetical protein CC78DRAFT_535598 [Lojkania enalia]|uniref:BZIP domain-containing protein n=1 Tax=Lojkania enalia TaxID=147567 RepID=A0A9P4K8L9_9PLEO|nr:hypothetical protein CC78DRAFT_535598 [Didymosphaeria enalia]
MARRSNQRDDDWHNVTDARKRKQIQDRLAQRARRKRLREAKDIAKQAPRQPETQRMPDTQADKSVTVSTNESYQIAHDTDSLPTESSSIPLYRGDLGLAGWIPANHGNALFFEAFMSTVWSPTTQPAIPITVFSALYINGKMLGLSCSKQESRRSLPTMDDIPLPLQPTMLQLTTIHNIQIDRWPFPRMRDTMISMSSIIDDEQFLEDLITTPSFTITPGHATWDPRAWKIQKPFADKWGYLFI